MVGRLTVGCALLAIGCGRVGFDALGDGGTGDGGTGDGGADANGGNVVGLGALTFPPGATILSIAQTADGGTRYAMTNGGGYRSIGGGPWIACGALDGDAMVVDAAGTLYLAAYDDFYASTDGCATWQPTNAQCYPSWLGLAADKVYGLCNGTGGGVRVLSAGTWSAVHTAFDSDKVDSFAASPDGQTIVIGSDLDGAIRSTNGGASWQAASTGLESDHVVGLAIAPTEPNRVYGIEASYDGEASDIVCSTNSGATWTSCYGNGGYSIAVDPTSSLHALAAPYNDLLSTTDGFVTHSDGLQTGEMDQANVNAIAFTPSGGVVVGTDRGMYEAADASLQWRAEQTGLAAWTIEDNSILVAGADRYIGTYAGVLVSQAGGPYTLSTVGMMANTESPGVVAVGTPDVLLTDGLAIRESTDHGRTWTELYALQAADGYSSDAIVMIGTRAFVGTGTQVLFADEPWTTWTPSRVGPAGQNVLGLLVRDGSLWAAGGNGLFVSPDRATTWSYVAAVTGNLQSIGLTPDGRVLAGTRTSLWISDPSATTWTQTSLDAGAIYASAASTTAIVVGADDGLFVSHDNGTTWAPIAGFVDQTPNALAFEPNGDLLVGTYGHGVTRLAPP